MLQTMCHRQSHLQTTSDLQTSLLTPDLPFIERRMKDEVLHLESRDGRRTRLLLPVFTRTQVTKG